MYNIGVCDECHREARVKQFYDDDLLWHVFICKDCEHIYE